MLRNLLGWLLESRKTTNLIDSISLCLQLINKEEELLGKDKSTFPLLQTVMTNKVPYEQLWGTTYEFSIKSEEWMNGMPRSPYAGAGWGWSNGSTLTIWKKVSSLNSGWTLQHTLILWIKAATVQFFWYDNDGRWGSKSQTYCQSKSRDMDWVVTRRGRWWENKIATPLVCYCKKRPKCYRHLQTTPFTLDPRRDTEKVESTELVD